MSYIAVDIYGTHIFINKPIRRFGKNLDWWFDIKGNNSIKMPNGTAKILNDNGLLDKNNVPFNIRDMNWGDSPIHIKGT